MSNSDLNKANEELKKLAEAEGVSMNENFKLDKNSLETVAGGELGSGLWDTYKRGMMASDGIDANTYGGGAKKRF